jgi:hypothetical protein
MIYQNNSVNSLRLVFGFTGTNIVNSSQEMYSWSGSDWTLQSTMTATLNGSGTRTTHVSLSPPFGGLGAADYTYTSSDYNQQTTVYSDTAGTTETGYSVYTYN